MSSDNQRETDIRRLYVFLRIFALCCWICPNSALTQPLASAGAADSVYKGWFWLNPLPQGNDLNGIYAFNTLRAVIVGNSGTVVTTTDGGDHWLFQTDVTGRDLDLKAVFFRDAARGFAVGDSGLILVTTNGGSSWALRQTSIRDITFNDISFDTSGFGWIVGDRGTILRTTNGGASWEIRPSPDERSLYSLHALSKYDIFACGQLGEVIRSTDAGATWDTIPPPALYDFRDIQFIGPSFGVIAGTKGHAYLTSDTTATWHPFQDLSRQTSLNLNKVAFYNPGQGWAVGDKGLVANTSDGGNTWRPQILDSTVDFHTVAFPTPQTGWIAGTGGRIFKVINGSLIVSQSSTLLSNLNAVEILDSHHGWAVGDAGRIFFTADSGVSWVTQETGASDRLTSVSFADVSHGCVGGENGTIFRTTNGGSLWTRVEVPTTAGIRSIRMFDVNRATALGDAGTILRSTDGGNSWAPEVYDPTVNFTSHAYLAQDTIWAVGYTGDLGRVALSLNGGLDFAPQDTFSPTRRLTSITFPNPGLGVMVGERNAKYGATIFRTTDHGASWRQRSSPLPADLRSVSFTEEDVGWACGDNGIILRSTDAGLSWRLLQSSTDRNLRGIKFLDPYTGFAVGDRGTILKTVDGGGVPLILPILRELPTISIITGNYPNPFNPGTYLTFQLAEPANVTLQIFSILGERIREFRLGFLDRGYYDNQYGAFQAPYWNGLDENGIPAPSGPYFYRIITKDRIQTLKMMLIR